MKDSTKSAQAVPAAKPIARWKRWHHKSRIVLMVLAAGAIIFYLVCTGLAKQYAGLGAALCVITCGGFLIWHAIHLFAEEDTLDERLLHQDTDKETNPAAPTQE